MVRNRIGLLAIAILSVACATPSPAGIRFELGAMEFHGGDALVIENVQSTTGGFAPGSLVTVRGRYHLASRDSGTLLLGTTTQGTATQDPEPAGHVPVARGSGSFELQHRIPAAGHLHVTFYDPATGAPFGGQYFGTGDTLLQTKNWSYER